MALKIVKKQPIATTSVVHATKGTQVTEQFTQEPVGGLLAVSGPHAMIEVSTSLTINLGKFNSVKVAVGITLPAELDELESVFEYGRAWMNSKMEAMVADVSPETAPTD
jgi:hypothetical protein